MSFNQKRASSSKSGTGNVVSGLRQTASAKISSTGEDSKSHLLNKEEEYKRLNAELEKKTATLVYEAEQVLKANERVISETSYLNKMSEMDFLTNETNANSSHYKSIIDKARQNHAVNLIDPKELSIFKKTIKNFEEEEEEEETQDTEEERQGYFENIEEEQAKSDQIRNMLSKISTKTDDDLISNLFPKSANDMSSEAQIRFLKAKLKVMQEEIDRMNGETGKKDEEISKLAQRCKELDEDRAKQLRISNSHQTQLEKVRKLHDETQAKINAQELQFQVMKKENEQLKKESKQNAQDQQQLELRLNRALEEIEKYKVQLQKSQSSTKDSNDQEKRRYEQTQTENKRLQRQKTELIQAFKKQLKLIDILKKQKMHLEAAKILQFSEDEFLAALEWSPQSEAGPNLVNQNSTRNNQNKTNNLGRPPSGPSNKLRSNLPNNSQNNTQRTNKIVSSRSVGSDINSLKEVNGVQVFNHDIDRDDNDDDEIYNDNFRYDNNQSENTNNNNDFDDDN